MQGPFNARNKEYVKLLARLLEKAERLTRPQAWSRALSAWSQMLGAMSLSRSLLATDPRMADEVLAAARRALLQT